MRDWYMEEWMIFGIVALLVLLISLAIWAGIKESREWEAFKVEHKCEMVAHKKGTTSLGVGPTMTGSGGGVTVVTVTSPSQTAWLCDDGVTYWR